MGGRRLALGVAALVAAGCLGSPPFSPGDPDGTPVASDAGEPEDGGEPADGGDPLLVGLLRWYRMDEAMDAGDGTGIAPDETGRGDGTCPNARCPALVAGHIGSAYEYDGIDDEILVADRAELHSPSGTVALWVYLNDSDPHMIVSKPFETELENSWLLYAPGDGSLFYETMTNYQMTGTGLLAGGRWLHLAATWSPEGNAAWVDGERVLDVGEGTLFDDNPVVLGADHDHGGQILPLHGLLDDVRIYDRVLPDDEIEALAAM